MVFQASNLLRSATAVTIKGKKVIEGKWERAFHWYGFSWDIKEELNLAAWNEAVSFATRLRVRIDSCAGYICNHTHNIGIDIFV